MLVIKVELHPFGDADNAKILGEMHIANTGDSESPRIGNYNIYQVYKNGYRSKKVMVKNHPRLDVSVWKLVSKALNALGHSKEQAILENRYDLRILAERAINEGWGPTEFSKAANELNDKLDKELEEK